MKNHFSLNKTNRSAPVLFPFALWQYKRSRCTAVKLKAPQPEAPEVLGIDHVMSLFGWSQQMGGNLISICCSCEWCHAATLGSVWPDRPRHMFEAAEHLTDRMLTQAQWNQQKKKNIFWNGKSRPLDIRSHCGPDNVRAGDGENTLGHRRTGTRIKTRRQKVMVLASKGNRRGCMAI